MTRCPVSALLADAVNGRTEANQDLRRTGVLIVAAARRRACHGEPNFPEPRPRHAHPGLIQSAQFQTALNACRSLLPKGFQP
jgi:hypothetical protein